MTTATQTKTEPQSIYALIPRIMQEVGAISKSKKNAAQGYSFRGIDDVMAAFHAPLAKHGVFYVPDVLEVSQTERQTAKGGTMICTQLKVAYTFFASDGSSITATVIGEAMDTGDKLALGVLLMLAAAVLGYRWFV